MRRRAGGDADCALLAIGTRTVKKPPTKSQVSSLMISSRALKGIVGRHDNRYRGLLCRPAVVVASWSANFSRNDRLKRTQSFRESFCVSLLRRLEYRLQSGF